ncbi:hypothetical protein J2W37_001041 [Variovorax paradoxus]|nr:hypothetical protein [Variovorax paradoxus]
MPPALPSAPRKPRTPRTAHELLDPPFPRHNRRGRRPGNRVGVLRWRRGWRWRRDRRSIDVRAAHHHGAVAGTRGAHCPCTRPRTQHALRAAARQRAGAPHLRLCQDDVLRRVHHRHRPRGRRRKPGLFRGAVRAAQERRQARGRPREERGSHLDSQRPDAGGAPLRFAGLRHAAGRPGRRSLHARRSQERCPIPRPSHGRWATCCRATRRRPKSTRPR